MSMLTIQCTYVSSTYELQSIKSYLEADDEFQWNFGTAKCATGEYREALEAFERVQVRPYATALIAYCYLLAKYDYY